MNGTNELVRAEGIDFDAMVRAVREAGAQFVSLLKELAPADGATAVPGLEWTVAETAVHMLTIVRRGTGDMRRSDSLPGLAALNDQCIDEVETRDPAEIAASLEREVERLTRGLARVDAKTAESMAVVLHAGVTSNLPSALSYVLFDFLVHGLDIARATQHDWSIDPAQAALGLHACLPLLAPWVKDAVRSGPAQRLAMSFPGDEDAIVLHVGEGAYVAKNEARRADADELDPVHVLLAISGRAPSQSPTVARLADWFEPI